MLYRQTPYKQRNNTESFMKCLKENCLNRSYLTTERVRINSKRARDYMADYFIDMLTNDRKETVDVHEMKATAIPANRIERMKKSFKTHRCAFDFDWNFCKIKIVRLQENKDEEVKNAVKTENK